MSNIKHTPGPWTFDDRHCSAFPMLCLYAADNMNPFHGTRSDEEQNANARLISAAPELLEFALFVLHGVEQGHIKAKQFLDFSDSEASSLQPQTVGSLAQKVIAKATGA